MAGSMAVHWVVMTVARMDLTKVVEMVGRTAAWRVVQRAVEWAVDWAVDWAGT